jgi:hypothetical protein
MPKEYKIQIGFNDSEVILTVDANGIKVIRSDDPDKEPLGIF